MTAALAALLAALAAGAGEPPGAEPVPAAPAASGARRPRTCLALAGGGARGGAHVGVLQVLEALRIPVDGVAGTSMGAVVGGLYAAGLSPAELAALVEALDWGDLLDDAAPRPLRPWRRKEGAAGLLPGGSLGLEDGRPRLPPALVAGRKVDFLLASRALRGGAAAEGGDFDRLPLPFRAAAVDAASGDPVVLRGGDLARAIRASMAIPGVFLPVTVDGRRLVDGGLARNLPVELCRELGAEVVIAVDVGPRPRPGGIDDPADPGTFGDTVAGLLLAGNVAASRAALQPGDVLVVPELGTVSMLAFERTGEAVRAGALAAWAREAALRPLAVSPAAWEAWRLAVRADRPAGPVDRVVLRNPTPLPDALLLDRIETRPGPLDLPRLAADLDRLHALGETETVGFRLVRRGEERVLEVDGQGRARGGLLLRPGLEAFAGSGGQTAFTLRLRASGGRPALGGITWRLTGALGREAEASGDAVLPLLPSGALFAGLSGGWSAWDAPDAAGEPRRASRALARADAGLVLLDQLELRAGLLAGSESGPGPAAGDAAVRERRGAAAFRLRLDLLDDPAFARRGALLAGDLLLEEPGLGAERRWQRLEGRAAAALGAGRHALQLYLRGGSALGSAPPRAEVVQLGGFRELSVLAPGERSGPYALLATATWLVELGRLPPLLGGALFAGLGLEGGGAGAEPADCGPARWQPSALALLGAATPAGPVAVAVAADGRGRVAGWLSLGWTLTPR